MNPIIDFETLPQIGTASLPALYISAQTALAQCERIDECKDWADRAAAMASYAKQAQDETLEKMAMRIRARAMLRCGELLKTFQAHGDGKPGRPKENGGNAPTISQRQVANQFGISKDQEVTAIRIANIPREQFDSLVESDNPPTISALAEEGTKKRVLTDLPHQG